LLLTLGGVLCRVVRKTRERKLKEKQERKTVERPSKQIVDKRQLHNYRVVQRNLVYVIGVPASIASEEVSWGNRVHKVPGPCCVKVVAHLFVIPTLFTSFCGNRSTLGNTGKFRRL
jgi:hypothetical protein